MQRFKEREDCYLRIAYKEVDGMTKRQVEEERKKEMIDYNMKTFGKVSIGVHGKELPKFSQDHTVKEWWKLKQGYVEQPEKISQKEMAMEKKYWANRDEMLLADTKSEPGPIDPFKTIHVKQEVKENILDKVTHINHFTPKSDEAEHEGPGIKKPHNYRWTTVEN